MHTLTLFNFKSASHNSSRWHMGFFFVFIYIYIYIIVSSVPVLHGFLLRITFYIHVIISEWNVSR